MVHAGDVCSARPWYTIANWIADPALYLWIIALKYSFWSWHKKTSLWWILAPCSGLNWWLDLTCESSQAACGGFYNVQNHNKSPGFIGIINANPNGRFYGGAIRLVSAPLTILTLDLDYRSLDLWSHRKPQSDWQPWRVSGLLYVIRGFVQILTIPK